MSIFEAIQGRRSIRTYTNQAVPATVIEEILEAARLAPSGSNTQPWRFIVVRSDEARARIVQACHNQQWMNQAPVHIVCIADVQAQYPEARELRIDEQSPQPEVKRVIRCTAIAIEHIVLQAQALGLSTCWVAWFTQSEIRPVLGIPEDKYVVAVITVGHSDEHPASRPRKAMHEIVRYESWDGEA